MKKLRSVLFDESGQVLPLFALMLMFLIGLTALAVDGGRIYYLENKAHNIAEASALSTFDYLKQGSEDSLVKDIAYEFAVANGAEVSEVSVETEYNVALADGTKVNRVVVVVELEHKMFFGGAVGMDDRVLEGRFSLTVPVESAESQDEIKRLAKEFVDAVGQFDNSELITNDYVSRVEYARKVYDKLPKEARDYVLDNHMAEVRKLIAAELRIFLLPGYPNFVEGMYNGLDIDEFVSNGYIPIANEEEINNIRYNAQYTFGKGTKWEREYNSGMDKKYIQVGDINFSKFGDFDPLGSLFTRFSGEFDGGGYVINKLKVNDKNYTGLFGYVDGGNLKNINLEDANIRGNKYVGGLVGRQNTTTTVENCHISGRVRGDEYVGGIVGYQSDSSIVSSHSDAEVKAKVRAGGLVGRQISSTVETSYSSGKVTGDNDIGGIVGGQLSSSVVNSYATGRIKGKDNIGGMVGYQLTSSVINSYAVGRVDGDKNVGGIVGRNWLSSVSNGYYDEETTRQSGSIWSSDGFYKSTDEMKTQSTYVSWDFDTIWKIEKDEYPTLQR